MRSSAALAASAEHLAQVETLYRTVLAEATRPEEPSTIFDVSKGNIRAAKILLLDVQKARRGKRVMSIHARSHSERLDLEQEWAQTLTHLSNDLVSRMNLDAAIRAAHGAWITAPPTPTDGLLVVPGSRSLKARLRKALSQPTRDDLTRVTGWGTDAGREARRALLSDNPDAEVLVLRDAEGNAVGITEFVREHGALRVQSMVVQPGTEYGPNLMQEVARLAAKDGLGISLQDVAPNAERFYEGLGMRRVGLSGGEFEWNPQEAAGFAATGGTVPPPGASTAGMGTAAEQMGMQQLALNILQGVPEGKQATVADVQRALMSEREAATWTSGAASAYVGLATKTAEQAGQVSLEHLGLGKTFSYASPRDMAASQFDVRGSKIIQQMYGNHRDSLTRIITDATNPAKPLTMSEVHARIKAEWPGMQRYQVERIARTETAAVWMGTAANAYAANGISQFETIVASGPSIGVESEDPCDECVDAATMVHSIDDDLPPWHPNCRCDIIPVLEDPETGDAWLPPDEPWTGGGDMSGPAEVEPAPLPPPPEPSPPPLEPAPLPEPPAPPAAPPDVEPRKMPMDRSGGTPTPEKPTPPEPKPEPPAPPEPPKPKVTVATAEDDPYRRYWKVPATTDVPFGLTANGLTNEELAAIDRYTGQATNGGYNVVNRWLRGLKRTSGKPLAEIKDAVAKLDSAIEKAPALDKPMTVYRGVANTDFYGAPKVGQVLEDPAYLSTSTTPELPTSWAHTHGDIWQIELPVGTKGIDVNAALEGTVHGPMGLDTATAKEKEIILARGQRLVVDEVTPRVTQYPNGTKITAYDVKAHVELEPPKPEPKPTPPPAPEVPKEPTVVDATKPDLPEPPPEPKPQGLEGVDMATKDGFEKMLEHYEGKTIRVKMGGRTFSGPVTRSTRGYMLLDRARFVRGFDRLESIEVKVGSRYKPWREYEAMTEEQRNPVPRATDSSRPRGQRTVVEEPPPPGGYQFEDAPPSGKLGVCPPTPQFKSLAEAKAFAEQFIAAQVDFGTGADLAGVQQSLDGMAKVMRPYGIKLDRFQVEKPRGKALAIFGRGSRRITIDGAKQYFSGNIIQAQKRVTNLKEMAKSNVKQNEVFKANQEYTRAEIERQLADSSRPDALKAQLRTKLENLDYSKRWIVAHVVDDPVRSILSHEAGHFLDYAYDLRKVFAEKLREAGYTYKDGLQLSEYGATEVAEVWAEATAANIVGVEVPPLIQKAYEDTLATVTKERITAKQAEIAARHEAVLGVQKQRERVLALRKRVGLH